MNEQELLQVREQLKAYKTLRLGLFKLPSVTFVSHTKKINTQQLNESIEIVDRELLKF
jgi:hypothetical protein